MFMYRVLLNSSATQFSWREIRKKRRTQLLLGLGWPANGSFHNSQVFVITWSLSFDFLCWYEALLPGERQFEPAISPFGFG